MPGILEGLRKAETIGDPNRPRIKSRFGGDFSLPRSKVKKMTLTEVAKKAEDPENWKVGMMPSNAQTMHGFPDDPADMREFIRLLTYGPADYPGRSWLTKYFGESKEELPFMKKYNEFYKRDRKMFESPEKKKLKK